MMRGSVGCRYVLPILHPSLIPLFALVSHTLCTVVLCIALADHIQGNDLPSDRYNKRPLTAFWLKPPEKGGNSSEGWVRGLDSAGGSHHLCLLVFAPKDSEKSFYPSACTLLFLPMMAFPGTPQQGLFPIRHPINAPPEIGRDRGGPLFNMFQGK